MSRKNTIGSGASIDWTLPHPHLLPPRSYNKRWDRLLTQSIRDYLDRQKLQEQQTTNG